MDLRHKLTKPLDKLDVNPSRPNEFTMSAAINGTAPASSGVTPEAIKAKLEGTMGATHVEIEDLSGGFCCPAQLSIFTPS